MAIPLIPILKTLPTILGALRDVTASLNARRSAGAVLKLEERTTRLEDDLLKTSSALSELTVQVQAIAEELRVQEEAQRAQAKKIQTL
jgi:prefoldin subunit 5